MTLCQWFADCDREAVTVRRHAKLGDVPVCVRCYSFLNNAMHRCWNIYQISETRYRRCLYQAGHGEDHESVEGIRWQEPAVFQFAECAAHRHSTCPKTHTIVSDDKTSDVYTDADDLVTLVCECGCHRMHSGKTIRVKAVKQEQVDKGKYMRRNG